MKLNPNFLMRRIAGSAVVVPCDGEENATVFQLNGSAAFLWEVLADGGTDTVSLTKALIQEYGINHDVAERDVLAFCALLKEYGALIEE